MIRIHIEDKRFGQTRLFDDFRLQLQRGELVCILGPSGCGKTTLLNMIAGLERGYRGAISTAPGLLTSYMFQEPRLLPWRTVEQNLELVVRGSKHPWSRQHRERLCERIPRLLEQMGLTDCRQRYPSQLSLGMARRVALARCLIIEPQLILMDEPFVSLDGDNLQALHRHLQQLRQLQPDLSILLVTHDIDEALALADRVILFKAPPNGQVDEFRPGQLAPNQQHRVVSTLEKLLHGGMEQQS